MPTAPYLSPELQQITSAALRPGGLALTDHAAKMCLLPQGSRVLDVGCGLGVTMDYLGRTYGVKTWGIDVSLQMLADALAGAGVKRLGGRLLQADGMSIPFASQTLDAVFCECVVSLMPDPGAFILECRRILCPGGRLVISDLYARCPPAEGFVFPAVTGGCLAGARGKEEMIQMVRQAGFDVKIWEDHTDDLKQMAAQMIFSKGSLDWFYNLMGNSEKLRQASCRSRPGYFLLIAVKKESIDG